MRAFARRFDTLAAQAYSPIAGGLLPAADDITALSRARDGTRHGRTTAITDHRDHHQGIAGPWPFRGRR